MASLTDRIRRFLNSPRGREARMRAERMARDPRNQARARGMLRRIGKRH